IEFGDQLFGGALAHAPIDVLTAAQLGVEAITVALGRLEARLHGVQLGLEVFALGRDGPLDPLLERLVALVEFFVVESDTAGLPSDLALAGVDATLALVEVALAFVGLMTALRLALVELSLSLGLTLAALALERDPTLVQ